MYLVLLPHLTKMDKLWWSKKNDGKGISLDDLNSFQTHFSSRILAWEETNVRESIQRNIAKQLLPQKARRTDRGQTDCLYRIPTDLNRELPKYTIKGNQF